MKFITVWSSILAVAAAAPVAMNNYPMVTISMCDGPTYEAFLAGRVPTGESTNIPINPTIMEIPINIYQDWENLPRYLVEIEVKHVTPGIEAHGFPVAVDDRDVECDIQLAFANDIIVRLGAGRRQLNNGEMVKVTGIRCYKRS